MNLAVKNPNKHIWEGWTVQNFIDELEPIFDLIIADLAMTRLKSENDVKVWCQDTQPYYKKHIPEVYDYFSRKFKAYHNGQTV